MVIPNTRIFSAMEAQELADFMYEWGDRNDELHTDFIEALDNARVIQISEDTN